MKKFLFLCLFPLLAPVSSVRGDAMQNVKSDEKALWEGSGAQDATFSAVTLSMVGWGIGLAGGIALLASAIHQSSSSSHDSGSSSH